MPGLRNISGVETIANNHLETTCLYASWVSHWQKTSNCLCQRFLSIKQYHYLSAVRGLSRCIVGRCLFG